MKLVAEVMMSLMVVEELDAEVATSVVKLQELLALGEIVLLKLSELLKLPSLQDLQHICRYPAMEQYRLNTSIRQNTDRSPRQRCLEEIFAGKSGLDLDSHWMMFFWSPLQGGAWQVRFVIG